jgi:nicotinamide-nucleotide amidase
MRAAIVAVGSELLGPDRLDTNSLSLTTLLDRHGWELLGKEVVGDDAERIAAVLRRRAAEVPLVIVTGGLGPTADDVTRPAAAAAFGRGLREDPAVVEDIRAKFARLGRAMPEVNRRQAEVIDGAILIPNPRGTAPGMALETGAATVFLLPGVPTELAGMVASTVEPWLAARSAGQGRERRCLKVACLPESEVEERITAVYQEFGREAISVLAHPGEVEVRYSAAGAPEARGERLAALEQALRVRLGDAVFTDRETGTLEEAVGELLLAAGLTLGTAESCTGGLVAERMTRVAGSSRYFLGGAVTYSNPLKERLLEVPAGLLAAHGAVSAEVVRAMAQGARRRLGVDCAVAVTGIAGPEGGSPEKPVGLVHVAVAGGGPPGEEEVEHRAARFPGDRERVRLQAGQLALELVRRRLRRRQAAHPGAAAATGVAP